MDGYLPLVKLAKDFTLRFYHARDEAFEREFEKNYKTLYRWFSLFNDRMSGKRENGRVFVPVSFYNTFMQVEKVSNAYKRAGISRRTLYNWMNRGEVEYIEPAGDRFVVSATLDRKLCSKVEFPIQNVLSNLHIIQLKQSGYLEDSKRTYLIDGIGDEGCTLFIEDRKVLVGTSMMIMCSIFEKELRSISNHPVYTHEINLIPKLVLYRLIEKRVVSFVSDAHKTAQITPAEEAVEEKSEEPACIPQETAV